MFLVQVKPWRSSKEWEFFSEKETFEEAEKDVKFLSSTPYWIRVRMLEVIGKVSNDYYYTDGTGVDWKYRDTNSKSS